MPAVLEQQGGQCGVAKEDRVWEMIEGSEANLKTYSEHTAGWKEGIGGL